MKVRREKTISAVSISRPRRAQRRADDLYGAARTLPISKQAAAAASGPHQIRLAWPDVGAYYAFGCRMTASPAS
jgi:hypothetical protein